MLSTISSLAAAFFAAMLAVISPGRPAAPRLTPTQRARAIQWQAWAAARTDRPVTRADVLATLDPDSDLAGARKIAPIPSEPTPSDPEPSPSDPIGPDPDPIPATPGQTPDDVVTLTEAAERLGISVATVRRYCSPSSGRLIRAGSGVTRASLENLAASR